MALLEEKRSQLQTLEAQLAELHQKLKEANKRKQKLEDDVTLCANKLMRAEKLIGRSGISLLSYPLRMCFILISFPGYIEL
jgi:dynein heavy chain